MLGIQCDCQTRRFLSYAESLCVATHSDKSGRQKADGHWQRPSGWFRRWRGCGVMRARKTELHRVGAKFNLQTCSESNGVNVTLPVYINFKKPNSKISPIIIIAIHWCYKYANLVPEGWSVYLEEVNQRLQHHPSRGCLVQHHFNMQDFSHEAKNSTQL